MNISIVIPCYHAAKTLDELCKRLHAVLELEPFKEEFEIVLVDDGSTDDTWKVMSDLQTKLPDAIVAIQLMRNFGQHNAVMCGLRDARGRLIVTMDDDLQNPPEEIPKLVKAINEGEFDLVYGQYMGKEHARWRNLGSTLVNMFYRLVFHSKITVTTEGLPRIRLREPLQLRLD